jgi:hypothetical protein
VDPDIDPSDLAAHRGPAWSIERSGSPTRSFDPCRRVGAIPDARVHQQRGGGRPHLHRPLGGDSRSPWCSTRPAWTRPRWRWCSGRRAGTRMRFNRSGDGSVDAGGHRDEGQVLPGPTGSRPGCCRGDLRHEEPQVAGAVYGRLRPALPGVLGGAGVVEGRHPCGTWSRIDVPPGERFGAGRCRGVGPGSGGGVRRGFGGSIGSRSPPTEAGPGGRRAEAAPQPDYWRLWRYGRWRSILRDRTRCSSGPSTNQGAVQTQASGPSASERGRPATIRSPSPAGASEATCSNRANSRSGAGGAFRVRSASPPHGHVFLRAAADPQSHRRDGSAPGNRAPGVSGIPSVPGGNEPEGLAVPDPHEHVHQQLPQTPAGATDGVDEEIADWYLYSKLAESGAEPSAEATVLDSLPDEEVQEALQSLPEQFRVAVLLADVEGFSYKEIADITGVPSVRSCPGCTEEERRWRSGWGSGPPTRTGSRIRGET